jgi:hypothetical protein
MQTIHDLILKIEGWKSLTAEALLSQLQSPTVDFSDSTDWTWRGIALVWDPDSGKRFGREGNRKLQDALMHAGDQWAVSQLSTGMALNDPEIQGILRHLDASGIVPGARHVADAVKRKISVLEQAGLTASLEDVTAAKNQLEISIWRRSKVDEAKDHLQRYTEAITVYVPGEGEEPRLEWHY